MAVWEVRKVSGKGYIFDTALQAFKDLDERGVQDIKLVYGVIHVGKITDFVDIDGLIASGKTKANFTAADVDLLQTSWQGKPLPLGHVYCVTLDDVPPGATAVDSLRKAFEMKIEDRMVMAEKNNMFSGGPSNEARKNVAQSSPAVGGVWGVKRKGPPRT